MASNALSGRRGTVPPPDWCISEPPPPIPLDGIYFLDNPYPTIRPGETWQLWATATRADLAPTAIIQVQIDASGQSVATPQTITNGATLFIEIIEIIGPGDYPCLVRWVWPDGIAQSQSTMLHVLPW